MATDGDPNIWHSSSPPMFCGKCGQVLLDNRFEKEMGFDRLTGQLLPPFVVNTRICTNYDPRGVPPHDYWILP